MMLERWKKHRELSKKAECKECASKRGFTTHEEKRVWARTSYRCSKCGDSFPPKQFDYKKLAKLEEENQVYLAVCIPCERDEPRIKTKWNALHKIRCVGCNKKKNENEFSLARQRCKNYATWRCLECDFPPCVSCGEKPDMPKRTPYLCEKCLYPPCKCGAERPRSTKYKSTNMKTWSCNTCR